MNDRTDEGRLSAAAIEIARRASALYDRLADVTSELALPACASNGDFAVAILAARTLVEVIRRDGTELGYAMDDEFLVTASNEAADEIRAFRQSRN